MEWPHTFRSSSFLGAVPGLAAQFKEVPSEFYELGDGAQITCPCGAASHMVPPAKMVPCPCGRLFLLTRSGLRAAQGMTEDEWNAHRAEAA